MKVSTRVILIVGIFGASLLGVGWYVCNLFTSSEAEMWEVTLEWGRLVPLPARAKEVTIETRGGPFTREFNGSFAAPLADIEQWLRDSPGPREVEPEAPAPRKRHYKIKAGGGAEHAEVNVDEATGVVTINVYWS